MIGLLFLPRLLGYFSKALPVGAILGLLYDYNKIR